MESAYRPKACAFHPREMIFNFCSTQDCLLPLCPTCVKVHTEEHRLEKTYGQFENIHKVVGDVSAFLDKTAKELSNCVEEVAEQQTARKKQQQELKKKMGEAKNKMIVLVERFFSDFEKEVEKSILSYNESMNDNYLQVSQRIAQLKQEIHDKNASLASEKVLRTLISFHAKGEKQTYNEQIANLRAKINYLDTQRVDVVCQPSEAQNVVEDLGSYIHLAFQNWQNEIKYVSDFVKTGFMSTVSDGFALRA